MSLRISNVRFSHFRNHDELSLGNLGPMTILVGPNAVGKTNIIEGIQLVTALDSFRNPKTDQLISWGCVSSRVEAHLQGDNRELDVAVVLDEKGRHYCLNGKRRPRQELWGVLPAVLFCPDDLQSVKGGPETRRAAIDALGVQVSRNYLSVKRDYEKLLRQKNRLLKEDVAPGYLDSVNEVLVKIGSQLFLYRLKILKGLRSLLPDLYSSTTGSDDEVFLEYRPSFSGEYLTEDETEGFLSNRASVEETLHDALERRELDERARKTSLIGPHRDKPEFTLKGRSAADYASQGQQRSIAIAYKLAELSLIEQITRQKPLLLLDDVMSELDSQRRATLTQHILGDVQTVITTTNLDYFTSDLLSHANVVSLPLKNQGSFR